MYLKPRNPTKRKIVQPLHLEDCLAKTVSSEDGRVLPGINVENHCRIVGLTAAEIIRRMPVSVRKNLIPDGAELVAACHDIGKVNPPFQKKIHRNAGSGKNLCPALMEIDPELEVPHSAVSQAALNELEGYIPWIVGRHHGASPIDLPLASDEIIGGTAWQRLRMELVDRLKEFFGCNWPSVGSSIQSAVLSGLTTVADWIGSGPVFDKFDQIENLNLQDLVSQAVDRAGFIAPAYSEEQSFDQIFFPYKPKPIQQCLIDMVDKPGVYILEALMGAGKTEAALMTAYNLVSRGMASGIYFALPTKLTSEKIHERVNSFLKRILLKSERQQPLLLHGNAWLNKTDFGEDAAPGYSWFNSRKRGLLAPFAVGTIDQALMAVINVKHGFVRAFGLTGKVVILDEVHSYDVYTGTIIDYLVKSLSEMGCTVILLSATLSTDRKKSLIDSSGAKITDNQPNHYPMVSKMLKGKQLEFSKPLDTENREIRIRSSVFEEEAFEEAAGRASKGEHVLWIENTVHEAQVVYRKMGAWARENGIESGLLHSRFPVTVRKEKDDYWVNAFGKEGKENRLSGGRILIGTQVLEQSLDIDADFLISRLAPTDMLLQRIGRLWRHEEIEPYRPDGAGRNALILMPTEEAIHEGSTGSFGASGNVYAPYVLARTSEIWRRLSLVKIPEDMRKLIEDTYYPRKEEGIMAKHWSQLCKERDKLRRFAFNSLAKAGKTLPENAATRHSEIPTCEVLLLAEDPTKNTYRFIDGEKITIQPRYRYSLKEKKMIAGKIMERFISVPHYLAPQVISRQDTEWLRPFVYISEEEETGVRIAILKESGIIRGLNGCSANNTYQLAYSMELGYSAEKKKLS